MKKIIDISVWQGVPNFVKVKATGVVGVMIKVSEGQRFFYQIAIQQAKAAKAAGLLIGYYHFGHPESTTHTAVDEANYFDAAIKKMGLPAPDLMYALDVEQVYLEIDGKSVEQKVPHGTLENWIKDFMSSFQSHGNGATMLYSNPAYLNEYLAPTHTLGTLPLWISEYAKTISAWVVGFPQKYALWQNVVGPLDGVAGNCDQDVCDEIPSLITIA
jgi:lysozyme